MSLPSDTKEETADAEPSTSSAPYIKRSYSFIAGLFAIIGVLASGVQIYDFFSNDKPSLYQEIKTSKLYIPEEAVIGQDRDQVVVLAVFFKDTISKFCDKEEVNILGTRGKNLYYDDKNCRVTKDIQRRLESLSNLRSDSASRLEISLKNNGGDVATNVRFRPNLSGRLVVVDNAGKEIVSQRVSDDTTVTLPDIHPSESFKLTLEVEDFNPDRYNVKYPETSFSKGLAENGIYSIVPPIFVKIADITSDVPVIFVIVFIMIAGFFGTMAVLVLVSVLVAFLKGKPISSVFSTETQPKVTPL